MLELLERAESLAAIRRGIDQFERGEGISVDDAEQGSGRSLTLTSLALAPRRVETRRQAGMPGPQKIRKRGRAGRYLFAGSVLPSGS